MVDALKTDAKAGHREHRGHRDGIRVTQISGCKKVDMVLKILIPASPLLRVG
jgi:hypothetical protein